MLSYKFPLEALRRLRVAQRDELQQHLAEAQRADDILMEQTSAVKAELEELALSQRANAAGHFDLNVLLDAQRYELVLRTQLETMLQQGQVLSREVERRRLAVTQADQQIKVLDKLDQRKAEAFRQTEQQREMKQLDEVATQGFLLEGFSRSAR